MRNLSDTLFIIPPRKVRGRKRIMGKLPKVNEVISRCVGSEGSIEKERKNKTKRDIDTGKEEV